MISRVSLTDSLVQLNLGRTNLTIQRLNQDQVFSLEDLLWIIPLHWHPIMHVEKFAQAQVDQYCKATGHVLDRGFYYLKQKNKAKDIRCHLWLKVQEDNSPNTIVLKWPYLYPNQRAKIEQLKQIKFFGKLSLDHQGQMQIIAPKLLQSEDKTPPVAIQYPTIKGAKSAYIKQLFNKIPKKLLAKYRRSYSRIYSPKL